MKTLYTAVVLSGLTYLSAGFASGQADQPPTDDEFAAQIQRLDPKNKKAVRLDALSWLNRHSARKNAGLALPALEKCIRTDADWEVRQQAVLDLSLIAKRLGKPCPLAVIEALHDKEDFVRYQAASCMPFFKTFAPGAVELLLCGVQADNAEIRSDCLRILARAAPNDAKALEAMEKAKADKVLDVRHSAHLALFTARDKLAEHVPYVITVREVPARILTPVAADSELGKHERAYRNLILLGTSLQLAEWSETRADELAIVLMRLLEHDAPVMRRGSVNLIGATAVKVDLPSSQGQSPFPAPGNLPPTWAEMLRPYLEKKPAAPAKKDPPPQPSRVASQLEKLGVEVALSRLRDEDADRSVRDAARFALERLARVKECR